MEKPWLPFVFVMLGVVIFLNISGGLGVAKAAEPNVVFSDDFEDGDISDWTTSTGGSGYVAAEQYPGPDWSLNIYSPQSSGTKAMVTSPSFILDESENYNVTMEFGFESPIHWVEVFRNQHINAVIDNKVGDSWRFICRYDGTNYLVMNMSEYTSYNIEFRVHPESNNYDIYVGDIFQRTCDCDPGGPSFPQFRVGDTELGSSNYGNAFYDDIIITQPVDSDEDGVMDPNDNCPYVYNPGQADRNSDGWGDICECRTVNNDSGHVDLGDFALIALSWQNSDPTVPGDINGDGIVDFNDLEILAYHWLSDCCPKHWAVIVGISDYNGISDVNYGDEDANDWYNYFEGLGYEHICVLGDGNIANYPQYDGLATEENICSQLKYVTENAGADDVIAFIFAGRGNDDGLGNSYLAAWDSGYGTGGYDGDLYDYELRDIFTAAPTTRVFFFLDTCKSGGMGDELMAMPNAANVYVTTGCQQDGFRNELPTHSNGAWNYWFLEAGLKGHFGSDPYTSMEECFIWADSQYNPGGDDEPMEFDGNANVTFTLTD